jgi:hypothetical protein
MKAKRKSTKPSRSKTGKSKAEDPAQYERFRQVARDLETDESKEAFDQMFRKIVPPRDSPS